jgi:hypothetical protein
MRSSPSPPSGETLLFTRPVAGEDVARARRYADRMPAVPAPDRNWGELIHGRKAVAELKQAVGNTVGKPTPPQASPTVERLWPN